MHKKRPPPAYRPPPPGYQPPVNVSHTLSAVPLVQRPPAGVESSPPQREEQHAVHMSNLERQKDEAEALQAIYGDDFEEFSDSEWRFKHSDGLSLVCHLPSMYPSDDPPVLVLSTSAAGGNAFIEHLVAQFDPDAEFGMAIAENFFEFCQAEELGTQQLESGESVNPETTEPEPETKAEADTADDDITAVTVTLPSAEVADALCMALASAAGFESYGGDSTSLFAQAKLGIAVELHGFELQLSIDSVDLQPDVVQEVTDWVASYFPDFGDQPPDMLSFGAGLVKLTDGLRRAQASDGVLVEAQTGEEDLEVLTGHPAYQRRLQNGETVQFRGGGNSLAPRLRSGEMRKFLPVKSHDDLKSKDIVFCTIKGRYWTHLLKKKTFVGGADEFMYTISNIGGHENGTIPLANIYGKVIDHWK